MAEIVKLPRTTVQKCSLCNSSSYAIIANQDRYGLPLRAAKCLQCGLVFLVDRLSAEGYQEFYQRFYRPIVSAYLGRTVNAQTIQAEQRSYARRLIRTLSLFLNSSEEKRTLLDIGGSTGVVSQIVNDATPHDVTILDPAPAELLEAEKKGLRVLQGFIEDCQIPHRSFDLILLCQTIEHLQDLGTAFDRIESILKESGWFFCDIVDFDELVFMHGNVEAALQIDHCYYLSQETAVQVLEKRGWAIACLDIAFAPPQVGLLMKLKKETAPNIQNLVRIRELQRCQTERALTKGIAAGPVDWLRIRTYRIREWVRRLQQLR